MKIIPTAVRQAAINFCREKFAREAVARRREFPQSTAPVSLHMVLSHDMMLMGMLALRSFEYHTGRLWSPVIHEDGTLTDDDARELQARFPDARIVRRAEADATLDDALRDHPVCRENRKKHHWFLKNFDTRHYAAHDHYIVMDSDIVFFQRPGLVLDWIADRPDTNWVMKDTREKYSGPREDIEREMGFPLWHKVNSGLDLMYRPSVDLALCEKFLTRCAPIAREYHFLEQSFFAVAASAWGKGGQLPPEYEISWTNFRRRGAICRHYVGPFKNDALYIEGATCFWLQNRNDPK